MQYPERFVLEGSDRQLPEGHTRVGDVDPDERATVTVYLRSRTQPEEGMRVSREEYAARFGAALVRWLPLRQGVGAGRHEEEQQAHVQQHE